MDMYVGQIQPYAFGFAPTGWALCQGQLLPISQNTALFSLIGTYYGGNGTSTFALPDMRGQVAVGAMPGEPGPQGGATSVTLDSTTLPSHNHNIVATTTEGNVGKSAGDVFATTGAAASKGGGQNTGSVRYSTRATTTTLAAQSVSLTGQSQPHNNMQPYLGLTYCICMQGVFPPRS